ncbi:MAG: MMPL family transporter [Myxococcales bacterium]|nr:MMPL family transporter [Myxococcales bacterium]
MSDETPSAKKARTGFVVKLLGAPSLLLFLTLVIGVVGLIGVSKLQSEEDLLVFLPEGDADVTVFRDVATRFGALRVALIGVEPKDGHKLFSAELLGRIDRLSTQLKNTTGVDRVVSPTTINDLVPIEGGVDLTLLVPQPIPSDDATLAKVRARALSQPTIRGNVVSADGEAGLIMVFVGDGVPTRQLAEKAQALARSELGPVAKLYFGGAPFAGQSIYDDTQRDVQRLVPIALLLFLFVVLSAFRDLLSVLLTVGTVGLSVLLALGVLGLHGDKFTVVMGTLPLVLFASGSQYAIHILGRYYLIRESEPSLSTLAAAREALTVAGPPVIVAALNCCVGFLSFLVMNISAMRAFGVACCVGIVACCVFSLTVAPSVVARFQADRPASEASFTRLGSVLWRLFGWVRGHRAIVSLSVVGLSAVCGYFMTRVTVRMEPKAFFRPGSEPALAQKFLDEKFGGAAFVQVLVEGDMTDPRSLHEVRRLSARARSLPGVTQVQTIVQPLAMVGDSMAGLRGLPQNAQQVVALLFFLEGEPSLRTMLAPDRKSVLVHVRVLGDAATVVSELRRYLGGRLPKAPQRHSQVELSEELSWLLPSPERSTRLSLIQQTVAQIEKEGLGLAGTAPIEPASDGVDSAELVRMSRAQAEAKRRLLTVLGASQVDASGRLLGRPADDVESWVEWVAAAILQPPVEAAAQSLSAHLTGEPMLDQAFSRAVDRNQWASLGIALAGVLIVLLFAQRSLVGAILSTLPAVMALGVVFGVLGLLGKPIDLGTSLVGSMVTSSGADFAMHYIWYLRRQPASQVVPRVGPVILTTAIVLGLAMGVMMLGASPPLRLFGALAAAGMLLSATFTFLLVPALLGKLPADPTS